MAACLQAAGSGLGRPLVEVETNLWDFLNRQRDSWSLTHGAALATAGLALSGSLSRLYIAASFQPTSLPPWGSHPDLDPLFSTERIEFVRDGRARGVSLSSSGSFSARPRWARYACAGRFWGGAYNCGCCDKCVRTMTALTILGVLGRYTRFPDPVDPHELLATPARPESQSL